jgi:hypothetical protein
MRNRIQTKIYTIQKTIQKSYSYTDAALQCVVEWGWGGSGISENALRGDNFIYRTQEFSHTKKRGLKNKDTRALQILFAGDF